MLYEKAFNLEGTNGCNQMHTMRNVVGHKKIMLYLMFDPSYIGDVLSKKSLEPAQVIFLVS